MFRYIKVSPPSRRYREEDVAYVPLDACPIGGIALQDRLLTGESINMESEFNRRVGEASLEDYDGDEEIANNSIHSDVAQDFVELLNLLVHAPGGAEFSEESEFQLVEDRDESDE